MIYRFGAFAIDPAIYELSQHGAPVSIEPQVFNVLWHLLRNRDRIISRDELIDAVWDGRAVSDTTLSSRIFAARRAVGDTGEAQEVIRTISRRGFRFVAEVSCEAAEAAAEAAGPGEPPATAPDAVLPSSLQPGVDVMVPALPPASRHIAVMPVLAVLPFKMASAGLDEYFCDGLTEDIISNLTHFRELRVIASGSSFHFKTRDVPLADIAARLGADYIVDGSVRREGNRLRVAVQLSEAATGVSLWADRYDRPMGDIFAVQDAVTQMIAASLGVKMQDTALTRALRKSPAELDAYDCLLHARRYTATLNEEMHAEARDLLEKAIGLDPTYAEAHALLANVYLAEHRFDANPRPDPIGRALEMALKAVQLDPQSAYAHCWLAIVHYFRKDIGKFEAEAARALDLNPTDPEILAEVGHYLSFMGAFERGIELSRRAQELNPLHPGWYHFSYARLHYRERCYEETLVDVQRISMPDFFWTHLMKAAALGQLGRKEAADSLAMMSRIKPGVTPAAAMTKWNVTDEDHAHLIEGLRKAGYEG
ncbi:winged helix-turn-helix domain-containing protein [Hoeflea sp. YIM 152468]|uniref:winged helix-turn-helix domain-containing tetratricopeptide repeat protein n=1 Tax=Hoeflea sp. YIM 152468 TaxID=3031759 RepID=UPI0023DC8C55|nr:winged helix-turn-helix domain-containing protein [Hoeflea sp. YIM 152468]MDF1607384.1 winged helix-turn-helix domain-containing protein [Hoeflea sp. YIM 152468]